VRGGVPAGVVAARFHAGLAAGLIALVEQAGGPATVALSGGVLQNALLHGLLADGLSARGYQVLTHSRVPPNDGGISLGQVAVAAARDRAH
jgi:hydrogenase maturation protein HypF